MKQQGKKQEKPEVEREPSPLAKAVAPALHRALPEGAALSVDEVARWLETPPELSLGDLAFPCFRLAKALRKGPPVIARELAQAICSRDWAIRVLTPSTGIYPPSRCSVSSKSLPVISRWAMTCTGTGFPYRNTTWPVGR